MAGLVPAIHVLARNAKDIPVIDLYTWTTPNGRKVSIALEELGLPYKVHAIDISKDEQFAPEFLKIAPNNRIPAIVDRDTNIALMESGAILIYLADKTGKLMPKSGEGRYRVLEWLMWQMGGVGPMAGQTHHFLRYVPRAKPDVDATYSQNRYRDEVARLYGVLDRRLATNEYIAGDFISIADFATWPWASQWIRQGQTLDDKPHFARWLDAVWSRPAVKRGKAVGEEWRNRPLSAAEQAESNRILFGTR